MNASDGECPKNIRFDIILAIPVVVPRACASPESPTPAPVSCQLSRARILRPLKLHQAAGPTRPR